MGADESKTFNFTLLDYDSDTEEVVYEYSVDSSIDSPITTISGIPTTYPPSYTVDIHSDNQTEQAVEGNIYVSAVISDKTESEEILRTYTATIYLTIQGLEPEP